MQAHAMHDNPASVALDLLAPHPDAGCLHAPIWTCTAHDDPASVALDLLALHPDERLSACPHAGPCDA